ncbi:MAG: hypothetical protein HDQ90_02985 [Desulfovibrio sp.]|nr:hypothetical protein [Desulfovibrio sp.]
MEILELNITAREPLIITAGAMRGMAHASLDYIPGNMLLGAFAAAWINAHPGAAPDDDPRFRRLFLSGEVSWGCAYPLCGGTRCVPVPLCFHREKNQPGLPVENEKNPKDARVIFNFLPLAEEDEGEEEAEGEVKVQGPRALYRQKFGESAPRPKFKKLSASFMNPDTLWQPDIRKLWNVRVALGRQRSAVEGQLFGFSSLAAGLRFKAEILCSPQAREDMEELVAANGSLRIGGSRSSGSGLVALEAGWKQGDARPPVKGQEFNIFLESAYYPSPSWENPLDNLLGALESQAGQKMTLQKCSLAHVRLDAFNSHWQKWRDSRGGLAAGSVLVIGCEKPAALPAALSLGAGRLEGYGRLLIDPAFLREPMPEIPDMPAARPERPLARPDLRDPVWRILRERALGRLAVRQARAWLHDKRWTKFLEKAAAQERPTASQRANIMEMELPQFEAMLGKTPGEQWRQAVCPNPFGLGNDSLDAIMTKLLDPGIFLKDFPLTVAIVLPGGEVSGQDRESCGREAHAIFKRELVRAWGKQARTSRPNGRGQ